MIVKFFIPYVKPTEFFSENVPAKISWLAFLWATIAIASIPLVRIGLGNLLGLLPEGMLAPYAIIHAFSLWEFPTVVLRKQMFLLPVYGAVLMLFALIVHILLTIAQAKRASFAATLRCVCYSTPCLLLAAVPFSGTIAAAIYASLFLGYSLRATHNVEWKFILPVVALTLPALFWSCRLLFP